MRARILARIAFVEDISDVNVDLADDRAGGLQLLVGGHVGGARFLDMPTVELPGDHNMPRVQDGPFGASERFAVSPGHEEEGYLELPGGQSGHPLSPYYRAGFMGWVTGEPLPFLPGATQHTLTLSPR